jgi:2-polyprenyl-3-methyl-5-hydroxy-6-metoxy-1,4-benzoquinol methylase
MSEIGKQAVNFKKVIKFINAKSVFQKKATEAIMNAADFQYFEFAEDFITRFNRAIAEGENFEYMATAYLNYTKSIRIEEMHFVKENTYRYNDFSEVYEKVYGRDDYMLDYVVGLGMTQIFWPNHYQIVRFFLDHYLPLINNFEKGAEIGVGHGLFHSELLRVAPRMTTTMLDISQTSLNMTTKLISATGLDPDRAKPVLCDVQKEIPLPDVSLDALLMGELIEHLGDGRSFMAAIAAKMKLSGFCFFTTAANAPAEDHILLFRDTKEIRELIDQAGWDVVDEYVGTLRGMTVEEAEAGGHNINYAAVLKTK